MNDSSGSFKKNRTQKTQNIALINSNPHEISSIKDSRELCYHAKKLLLLRDQRLDAVSSKFMRKHIPTCTYCKSVNDNIRKLLLVIEKNIPDTAMDTSIEQDVHLEISELVKSVYKQYDFNVSDKFDKAKILIGELWLNLAAAVKSKDIYKYFVVSLVTAIVIKLIS